MNPDKTPPAPATAFAHQLLQAFTEAQIILATRPSSKAEGALQILWKGDAADLLAEKIKPLLEATIRATVHDPNVLEDVIAMLTVGHIKGDAPATTISRAVAAAMLVAFGIHPTYGDAFNLATLYQGDLLEPAQRDTLESFKRDGAQILPISRYSRVKLGKDTFLIHPDGTYTLLETDQPAPNTPAE